MRLRSWIRYHLCEGWAVAGYYFLSSVAFLSFSLILPAIFLCCFILFVNSWAWIRFWAHEFPWGTRAGMTPPKVGVAGCSIPPKHLGGSDPPCFPEPGVAGGV